VALLRGLELVFITVEECRQGDVVGALEIAALLENGSLLQMIQRVVRDKTSLL
jgi:hypothetical protein